MKYIMAIDQGTTGSRTQLIDEEGCVVASCYKEHRQIYPEPGWVEHDPLEIWLNVLELMRGVLDTTCINIHDVLAIGITNQRETVVVWDRITGQPLMNAIVWQCRRTSETIASLKRQGLEGFVRARTGLVLDPYFSATKVRWILDNVPEAKILADQGRLAMGTIDTWLIWNLSGGRCHVTDVSNASRTLLFDIRRLAWDDELLEAFGVPTSSLPMVVDSAGQIAVTSPELLGASIPVTGCAGDQQSATFGQTCFQVGQAKNTYGTGCFMLMVTGRQPVESKNRLLTTVGWKIGNDVTYALEGSVFVAGAAVGWLRDGLGMITKASDSESLASEVDDTGGVYFVPALTGLGAPYWDADARGAIVGLTRGTDKRHLARAAIESMAYQSYDLIKAMQSDVGHPLEVLRVDGGAAANSFLVQFQADILGVPVERPANVETTCLGAAYLAGVGVGQWTLDELVARRGIDRVFMPEMTDDKRLHLLSGWKDAIDRTLSSRTSSSAN